MASEDSSNGASPWRGGVAIFLIAAVAYATMALVSMRALDFRGSFVALTFAGLGASVVAIPALLGLAGRRLFRLAPLFAALAILLLVGAWFVAATDPFCERGYVIDDGSCAWE